jgi:RDD family
VNVGVSLGVFMLALAAIWFAAWVTDRQGPLPERGRHLGDHRVCGLGVHLFRLFLGRERQDAGMALFGVRVVRDDGTDASGRRAVVRTLALPLSFLFLGLGFAGILLGDRRRALHDVIAGTAVIYSWDARAARLRFLSRS